MSTMVKVVSTISLGEGRLDLNGFDPNLCNFSIENEGDKLVYLDELIADAEDFCRLYKKLFGEELKYTIRITKAHGERKVVVDFED